MSCAPVLALSKWRCVVCAVPEKLLGWHHRCHPHDGAASRSVVFLGWEMGFAGWEMVFMGWEMAFVGLMSPASCASPTLEAAQELAGDASGWNVWSLSPSLSISLSLSIEYVFLLPTGTRLHGILCMCVCFVVKHARHMPCLTAPSL